MRFVSASLCLMVLTGCFGELFAGRTVYLSTEYTIDRARIGGISLDPPRIEPGNTYDLSWLVVAPEDQEVGEVTVRTCGLGRDVPTYIWDLNCFQIPDEVTVLATGNRLETVSFSPPETPSLAACTDAWRADGEPQDSAWWDSGDWGDDDLGCSHYLPILIEADIGGTPTFAATFVAWYADATGEDLPPSARDARIAIQAPSDGAAGETVDVTVVVAGDHRRGEFVWYVDGGVLEDTGWTVAQTFVDDDPAWPDGYTTTTNRWTLPDEGNPRIFAVLPASDGWEVWSANSTWTSTRVEVR